MDDPILELTMQRTLPDVTPEAIWRVWTDPALLAPVFAPAPVETEILALDPRPGGRFATLMRIPEAGEVTGEGCVLLAQPGRRFVWTNVLGEGFRPQTVAPGGFAFTADLRFTPTPDGGTLYDVRALHATQEEAQRHHAMGFESGWGIVAQQIAEAARRL